MRVVSAQSQLHYDNVYFSEHILWFDDARRAHGDPQNKENVDDNFEDE